MFAIKMLTYLNFFFHSTLFVLFNDLILTQYVQHNTLSVNVNVKIKKIKIQKDIR